MKQWVLPLFLALASFANAQTTTKYDIPVHFCGPANGRCFSVPYDSAPSPLSQVGTIDMYGIQPGGILIFNGVIISGTWVRVVTSTATVGPIITIPYWPYRIVSGTQTVTFAGPTADGGALSGTIFLNTGYYVTQASGRAGGGAHWLIQNGSLTLN
jgi:hypothetical protein